MPCGFYLFVHLGVQLKSECQQSGLLYVSPPFLYREITPSWLMSPPGHTDEGAKGRRPWIHTPDLQSCRRGRPAVLGFWAPRPRTCPAPSALLAPFNALSSLPPTAHAEFSGEKSVPLVVVTPLTGGFPLGIVAVARAAAHPPLAPSPCLCASHLSALLPAATPTQRPACLFPPPALPRRAWWLLPGSHSLHEASFAPPLSHCTGNCAALP